MPYTINVKYFRSEKITFIDVMKEIKITRNKKY